MKQTRLMSFIESIINIAVGFGISLAAQAFFLPLLGVQISFTQNVIFAVIMTAISIGRSYVLRRVFEALHIRNPLSPGALAIIAERRRQIESEGWTLEHDDAHPRGELAQAGAAYALNAALADENETADKYRAASPPEQWVWSFSWWKPQDFRRDLVKAGALILAELDRFDRSKKQRRV